MENAENDFKRKKERELAEMNKILKSAEMLKQA